MKDASAPGERERASGLMSSASRPKAAITGTAISMENRAASLRVMPSARAAVMVTPERDAPGISARHWASPIMTAPP